MMFRYSNNGDYRCAIPILFSTENLVSQEVVPGNSYYFLQRTTWFFIDILTSWGCTLVLIFVSHNNAISQPTPLYPQVKRRKRRGNIKTLEEIESYPRTSERNRAFLHHLICAK